MASPSQRSQPPTAPPATPAGGWGWVDGVLIPLLAIGMWAAWLTPFLYLLLQGGILYPSGIVFPAWLLYALLAGASGLQGLLRRVRWGRAGRWGGVISAGVGLVAVVAATGWVLGAEPHHLGAWLRVLGAVLARPGEGWPAPPVVGVVCGLAWLWGLAATWQDHQELFYGFLIGVIGFGVALLAPARVFWETATLSVIGYLLAFAVASLLALGLASAQGALPGIEHPAGAPHARTEWLVAVGIVVAGVLAVGWFAAPLISPDVPRRVAALFRPLGRWLEIILSYVLLGLAYVLFAVLKPLLALLRALVARRWDTLVEALEGFLAETERLAEGAAREPAAPGAGAGVLAFFRVLVIATLAVALVVAFAYALRRMRPRRGGAGEERESVFTRELLAAQLTGLLSRRRRAPPEPFVPLAGEGPRLRIRRLYRAFLARMAERGVAHPPAATPRAYARRVRPTLPREEEALDALTEAYLLARYAPEEPPAAAVARAEAAWARLDRALGERPGARQPTR